MSWPASSNAQETSSASEQIQTTVDGRHFITDAGVRLFLKFEADSRALRQAEVNAEKATATANAERGARVRVDELLTEERAISDARLVELTDTRSTVRSLQRRPTVVVAVLIATAAFVVGGAVGYGVARLTQDQLVLVDP